MILIEITKVGLDLYLTNQIVDILLWSWITLIMIKRVVCRQAARTYHFYSDIMLLLASLVAITQFSDQFYSIVTHVRAVPNMTRSIIWMLFHKLITGGILIKYKKSQPKLFSNIIQEIKYVFTLGMLRKYGEKT